MIDVFKPHYINNNNLFLHIVALSEDMYLKQYKVNNKRNNKVNKFKFVTVH